MALPSDAGAGDLLCSFSLSFSVGVVGAATDEGVAGIGTGGGGKTGGGINGTVDFSTIQWQKNETETHHWSNLLVSPGLSLYHINGTLFPKSVVLVAANNL